MIRFAVLWLIAGALELPVLLLLLGWSAPVPGWAGALLHVAAAVVVFFAPPKERGWFKRTRHWGEPLFWLTLALPAFGWAAAGVLTLARWDAPHDKEAYRFEDDGPDDWNPLAAALDAEAHDVLPAVDALHSSDRALKRGAIEALTRIRTPEAVEWLLKTRSNPDAEARFYATSALTRLKRDFETAVQAAEREAYRRPREPELRRAVQQARYDYAASGVLDEGARRSLLLECRAGLEPGDPLLYKVERLLDPVRALDLLGPDQARERADTLFALRRYRELRELLKSRPFDEPEWRTAQLWWTNG